MMNFRYILFLIIPISVNAGFYSEEYSTNSTNGVITSTILFGLEPDAASEAMGKTSSGAASSSRSSFYNPAYVCLTNGVKLYGTHIWNNSDLIHPKHFMIDGGISYNRFLNAEISNLIGKIDQ